jgi:hypothetical protein
MDGLVHVSVRGLEAAYSASREAYALGLAAIRAEVDTWPEVAAAALSREIPPTWDTGTVFTGPVKPSPIRPAVDASQEDMAAYARGLRALGTTTDLYRVDPSFFDLFSIRILRGRALAPGDGDRDAVVGERIAAELWPTGDPVGQLFTIGRTAGYRVVGVAAEIRLPTLEADLDRPELYLPLGTSSTSLRVSVRCRAECPDVATMDARMKRVHAALGTRALTTAETTYLAQLRLPRAIAEIGGMFAVVAVLTAAGGLFSVMTYAVGRRRREFGIRAALGAAPGAMRRLVFRDGFTLVAVGAAGGVAGGWLVGKALAAFRYGVTAADPLAWSAVIGTLGLIALAASWRPARQAGRADPVALLREE